jgi:hypothetical protein
MTNSVKTLIGQRNIFRPAAFWKSTFISMPDSSFFELMRSVFGKIKTPFNKQQLIKALESFLLRKDVQTTIAAFIDDTESKIIAAISLFEEPVLQQLETFFSGELSSALLQDKIVNLEERFILYRFAEENKTRLALNPILKTVLLPFTKNTSSLFFLTAANKDSRPQSKNILPKDMPGALQMLGLLYVDADILVPDKKYYDNFNMLPVRERMEYCAAASLLYRERTSSQEILPPLFREKIRGIVNLIHAFLNSLTMEYQYPKETLKRIVEVLKAQTGTNINTEKLITVLEETGLMEETSSGIYMPGEYLYDEKKETADPAGNYFPSPVSALSLKEHIMPVTANVLNCSICPCEIKASFHSIINKKQLSDAEKTELSARIERRLIVCKSQLEYADIRYEKLEARHMDYTGKYNIAKYAVSHTAPVEIIWKNKGNEKTIYGIPLTLEKEENEIIIKIENELIPLAKISQIRRIRKSLFDTQ